MASSGLTMSAADYGRSVSGAKKLENDFVTDIEALIKVLKGDKYADFKKTIKANWVGADATDFLNDVEKTRKNLESSLRNLKTKFNGAVSADAKQFKQFQSKNVK